MFKKPQHLRLSNFFIYRRTHLLLPVAAALLQTQLCQELWRIATASQALLIENEPRFTVTIVSVALAFQHHFCSITKGGWKARESSGMLSQAGQQQGIRHLSSQQCRAAPDTSRAAHLHQPARQAGRISCQRDELPLMADFPWAVENKTLHPVVGQCSPWRA